MHPEWQRCFISNLNKFFGRLEDVKIQFIIATHSPIILSDILKENTVYLGDNKIDESEKDWHFLTHLDPIFVRECPNENEESLKYIKYYL